MSADLITFGIAFIVLLWVNIQLYRNDTASRTHRESMTALFSSTPKARLLKLRLVYGGPLALCGLMIIICL